MTQQNPHTGDGKLLLAIGGLVIAGAAAIALLAGLGVEQDDDAAAAEARPSAATASRVERGRARDAGFGAESGTPGPDALQASIDKIPGSTIGPEIAEAIEVEPAQAYPVDPAADFAAVASAAWVAREYDKAAAYWAADADQRPERAYSHYMLGLSLWKSGRLDDAESALRRSAELNDSSIRTFINLSRVLNEKDSFEAALEAAESARAIDPQHPQALYVQARSLNNMGRTDDAVVALEQALAFDSEYGHALNLLGLIRIHQGRAESAVESLLLAARHEPGCAFVHANLGRALELSGRPGEAGEAFRAALELDPGQKTAVAGLRRVEPLAPAEEATDETGATEAVASVGEEGAVEEESSAADGAI
jgi:tetratricopeptide (TPR) repeat protein